MYQVIVSNVGSVIVTPNSEHAYEVFASYKQLSEVRTSRVWGETVTLLNLDTDHVEAEHRGSLIDDDI